MPDVHVVRAHRKESDERSTEKHCKTKITGRSRCQSGKSEIRFSGEEEKEDVVVLSIVEKSEKALWNKKQKT